MVLKSITILLARNRSKRVTCNALLIIVQYKLIKSLKLTQQYAQIFVLGRYIFLEAQFFLSSNSR